MLEPLWGRIDAQPWEWLFKVLLAWFGASVGLGLLVGRLQGRCRATSVERRCCCLDQAGDAELEEALELACLASHVGNEAAARRWRAEVGSALDKQRGGALDEAPDVDAVSVTAGGGDVLEWRPRRFSPGVNGGTD